MARTVRFEPFLQCFVPGSGRRGRDCRLGEIHMKKELFSIPNLLGYLRLILVPVFLILYYRADSWGAYGVAFGVLAVAMLTDFFDGKIARKFNMVTDFGKALDPVADKIVQGSVAIAVCFRFPNMLFFLLVFILKEIYMAVMGVYLIKTRKYWTPAQWYGKITTAVVDVAVFALLLIPGIPKRAADIVIGVLIIFVIFCLIKYVQFHKKILREENQTDN